MRKIFGTALIALTLATPPALAQQVAKKGPASGASSPAKPSEAAHADARRFALAYVPDSTVEQSSREFDRGFDQSTKNQANVSQIEIQYPGALAAMKAAGRTHLVKRMLEMLPGLREKVADYMLANFNADQLKDIADYFASDSGVRMVATVSGSMDATKLVDMKEGAVIVRSDLKSLESALDFGFLAKLSKADLEQFTKFTFSPVGRVFNTKTAGLAKVVGDESNAMITVLGPEASAKGIEALRDFVAAARPKQ